MRTWFLEKMDIVLYHKFTQHKANRKELLDTGDAELIEVSRANSILGALPEFTNRTPKWITSGVSELIRAEGTS